MKRIAIAFLSVITILVPPTAQAEVPSFPHLSPPAYQAPIIPGYYQLTWVGQWQIPPRPEFTNIPSLDISDINNPGLNYGYSVFPKCSKEITVRCISSIEFKKQGESNWSSASFLKYLPVTTKPFKTINRDRYLEWTKEDIDSRRNSIWPLDSARSSIWEIDTDLGKQKYLSTISIGYDALFKRYSQFKLNLTPVIEVNITDAKQYENLDPNKSWCARTGYGDSFFLYNNFHPLVDSDPRTGNYDYCLVKTDFEKNIILRVVTQLSPEFGEKGFANWVTSRTSETTAYSTSMGKGKPTLAIFEGHPATIQAGVTQIPHTLEGFNSYWSGNPHKKDFDEGKYEPNWFEQFKSNWGIGSEFSGGEGWYGLGWDAIDQWRSTEKYIDPKLTIEHNLWEFSVIPLEEAGDLWVSKCKNVMSAAPSFSGVISTNATVFVQGPPKLDSDGNLDFQIAATSLKENGEVNLGTYNLSVADDVANCIWGTSSLGMGASISVITQEGIKQIATTSMGKSNGQLNFAASGFHYSTNKIRISLGAKVQNTSINRPIRILITCVKGKLTKKVTAVNPKCPAGYKKK
ncbi:MAG: hypothetical protein ACKOPU_06825 [Candidatus Planktophila sp.]